VKALEERTGLGDGSGQRSTQITAELILHAKGKVLEALCAKLRKHASRPDRHGELLGLCLQQLGGIDSDFASQGIPALAAGHVAGGIAAIPPDEKFVGVDRKRRYLRTVEPFQAIQDFAERKS